MRASLLPLVVPAFSEKRFRSGIKTHRSDCTSLNDRLRIFDNFVLLPLRRISIRPLLMAVEGPMGKIPLLRVDLFGSARVVRSLEMAQENAHFKLVGPRFA